jgi:lipid-binding SYLF domain-containing protein
MKTKMKLVIASTLLIMSGTMFAASLPSDDSDDDKNVKKANKTILMSVEALDNVMENTESYIPPSLIIQSEGIVIFPSAIKLAFGVAGGQGARGIALTRNADHSWSNPFFVSLGEGSLGLQLGAQKTDIILLFKNKEDIMGLDDADIALGADMGVAAGPASRVSSATTDVSFESEIYSYYRSRGLFAGISFKGGVLSYNDDVNESIFRMNDISAKDIFDEPESAYNENVIDLIDAINMYGE